MWVLTKLLWRSFITFLPKRKTREFLYLHFSLLKTISFGQEDTNAQEWRSGHSITFSRITVKNTALTLNTFTLGNLSSRLSSSSKMSWAGESRRRNCVFLWSETTRELTFVELIELAGRPFWPKPEFTTPNKTMRRILRQWWFKISKRQ